MGASVSKATINDIDGIVKIHQEAFKDFFLTSLGEDFLKLYYSTFIKCEDGVVYCAKKNDIIVGFSATSFVSHGFNSKLIKGNLVKYGIMAVKLLFTKPKSVLRLAKNLNKESNDANVKDDGMYAELYSIAVSPECQGEGVGRFLLTVTETDVRDYNNVISLTTDYCNNDKTIAFYRALGYQEFYDFITYPNRRMWRMIKDLKK